jgi:DNA-binding MarR family transcriptional regulator
MPSHRTSERNAQKLIELLPRMLQGLLRREDNFLTQGKITFPQLIAMEQLKQETCLRMSDLAKRMNVQTASATGLIDRLHRAGYVKRCPDPKDRRVVKIRLTPAGLKIINKIFEQKKKVMGDVFRQLPQKDSTQYVNALEKICAILSRQ